MNSFDLIHSLVFGCFVGVMAGFFALILASILIQINKIKKSQYQHKEYPLKPSQCNLHKWEYQHNWYICSKCGFIAGGGFDEN